MTATLMPKPQWTGRSPDFRGISPPWWKTNWTTPYAFVLSLGIEIQNCNKKVDSAWETGCSRR